MHNHRINKKGQQFFQKLGESDVTVPLVEIYLFLSFSARRLEKLNNESYVKKMQVAVNNYCSDLPKNVQASFNGCPVIPPCCSN